MKEFKEIKSKSDLAIALSKLEVFDSPKVSAEQYPMDSEIGATALWSCYVKGDLEGKVSADLGCGTGILGIGFLLMGAKKVYFLDNDKSAIEIAKKNYEASKSEFRIEGEAIFLLMDIKDFNEECDTIIQNPPFGVKVRHADRAFLEKATKKGKVIYTFHKSESKQFIERFAAKNRLKISEVWNFRYPLKASYRFHTRKIRYIEVSCFRIEKEKVFK